MGDVLDRPGIPRKAGGLAPGDRVTGPSGTVDYEVRFVERAQGRVQVIDTSGAVRTYHQGEVVRVLPAA